MAHASSAVSPCIGVCRMHDGSGWCEGCLRTLDEIATWGGASEAERLDVLSRLPARRRQWRLLRPAANPPPGSPGCP